MLKSLEEEQNYSKRGNQICHEKVACELGLGEWAGFWWEGGILNVYEEGSKQKEGNRRRELPSVNTGGRLSCSSLFGWLAEARRASSRRRWYVSLEQRWWLPLHGLWGTGVLSRFPTNLPSDWANMSGISVSLHCSLWNPGWDKYLVLCSPLTAIWFTWRTLKMYMLGHLPE